MAADNVQIMWILAILFALLVRSNCQDNDDSFQSERRQSGEMEANTKQDAAFDRELASYRRTPMPPPRRSEVERAYRNQKNDILNNASRTDAREIRRDSSSITFYPYVEYIPYNMWTSFEKDCCPRQWNYGCKSRELRLPCINMRLENRNRWCCPFYPTVYIKKCACNKCAIRTPNCAKEGRCRRRYSMKRYYAVCYKDGGWNTIYYIKRYLPTSCYCSTDRNNRS